MVRRLRSQQLEGFILTPVPLHRRRKRSRGYNQSEILARYVSDVLDLPLEADGLERVRDTESQVGRSESDRRRNVRGAFSASKAKFAGKSVLLIDDISTTGSTLEACAAACNRAGAVCGEGGRGCSRLVAARRRNLAASGIGASCGLTKTSSIGID